MTSSSLRRSTRGKNTRFPRSSKPQITPVKTRTVTLLPETKAMKKLLSKDTKMLTVAQAEKIAAYLRIIALKNGKRKPKSKIGIAKKYRKRNGARDSSSETSSEDSEGTSSKDWSNIIKAQPDVTNKKEDKSVPGETYSIGNLRTKDSIRKDLKVVKWNEEENLIQCEIQARLAIQTDPELRGFYKRKIDPRIHNGEMKTMVRIHQILVEKKGTLDIVFNEALLKFIKNERYLPPKQRLLMIGNKSLDWQTNVKVFSDIPKENPANADIPNTMLYRYTNSLHVDKKKFKNLLDLGKTEVKCECCHSGSVVPCWANEKCPCYKQNVRLRGIQKIMNQMSHSRTNFSTFEPIYLRDNDSYFDTFGFACSESCGCKGRCTNNVTLLLEKDIYQLEVFRKNANMGFGIRTNTAIPRGTPILEFTGELVQGKVPVSDGDYVYSVFQEAENGEDLISATLMKEKKVNKKQVQELKEHLAEGKEWFINPKRIGNLARTCCHSCEPNLSLVRVFQKGFTPAHCRLILVTQEVVFPGVELTFDYGAKYIEEHLKNNCLCGRASCKSSPLYKMMDEANEKSLEMYQTLRYHYRYNDYKTKVLDPIEEKVAAGTSST
ncbi:hypothetical protein L3Y34_004735 [Caenorhabditis briggsae]|uniref:SET domain-containing protein n=1 Tax=Caenorhabditis briggsae TaxID=6238 RepID=A0AAE9D564_CAEBR|nr:hypothetical protein L3Y34_004735 [Caenorhabditis briggsae]